MTRRRGRAGLAQYTPTNAMHPQQQQSMVNYNQQHHYEQHAQSFVQVYHPQYQTQYHPPYYGQMPRWAAQLQHGAIQMQQGALQMQRCAIQMQQGDTQLRQCAQIAEAAVNRSHPMNQGVPMIGDVSGDITFTGGSIHVPNLTITHQAQQQPQSENYQHNTVSRRSNGYRKRNKTSNTCGVCKAAGRNHSNHSQAKCYYLTTRRGQKQQEKLRQKRLNAERLALEAAQGFVEEEEVQDEEVQLKQEPKKEPDEVERFLQERSNERELVDGLLEEESRQEIIAEIKIKQEQIEVIKKIKQEPMDDDY